MKVETISVWNRLSVTENALYFHPASILASLKTHSHYGVMDFQKREEKNKNFINVISWRKIILQFYANFTNVSQYQRRYWKASFIHLSKRNEWKTECDLTFSQLFPSLAEIKQLLQYWDGN